MTYGTVGHVGHESSQANTPGLLLCEVAEADALDFALDFKGDLAESDCCAHPRHVTHSFGGHDSGV